MPPRKSKPKTQLGEIRIIAGRYRNRKLQVRNHEGLRPTGNRIKETLFNWLSQDLSDSTCLDLFSGSGSLAFEAASRGAKQVIAVEIDPQNTALLNAAKETLACKNVTIVNDKALTWLKSYQGKIDMAFVDPPFADNLHSETLNMLCQHPGISLSTKIYIEASTQQVFDIPLGWSWLRHKTSGDVQYGLLGKIQQS